MNVQEIRLKARELGLKNYARFRKHELIRAIQLAEGNRDCFRAVQDCGQTDCCWWSDCQQN